MPCMPHLPLFVSLGFCLANSLSSDLLGLRVQRLHQREVCLSTVVKAGFLFYSREFLEKLLLTDERSLVESKRGLDNILVLECFHGVRGARYGFQQFLGLQNCWREVEVLVKLVSLFKGVYVSKIFSVEHGFRIQGSAGCLHCGRS
jgi:hypothetical protein